MSKLGTGAAARMAELRHPLDLDGVGEVVISMVWDGDADLALECAQQGIAWGLATRGYAHDPTRIDRLLGMKAILAGVVGHRRHARVMRSLRTSTKAVRRSVRSLP